MTWKEGMPHRGCMWREDILSHYLGLV